MEKFQPHTQIPRNIQAFFRFLRHGAEDKLPFHVQFGGFLNSGRPFLSRGRRPYERSFSIQGDKVVLIGWPIQRKPLRVSDPTKEQHQREEFLYPDHLDKLRRKAQEYGILHKHYTNLNDIDNDLYMRLGLIDITVSQSRVDAAVHKVRSHLSQIEPVTEEISFPKLGVAEYEDPTLPPSSTKFQLLADISFE